MAAGEALGREPGLLADVTVPQRRRRNSGFDAECREAQRQGREPPLGVDEVCAERLLAHPRAGEKIMQIVARRGSTVSPHLSEHWMATQAHYHVVVRRAWPTHGRGPTGSGIGCGR